MTAGISQLISRCVVVSAKVPSVEVSENTTDDDETLEDDAAQDNFVICTIILFLERKVTQQCRKLLYCRPKVWFI